MPAAVPLVTPEVVALRPLPVRSVSVLVPLTHESALYRPHGAFVAMSVWKAVTVVFFDPQAVIGFRIRGKAVLETFGPLFQQAATQLQGMGFKPKAVVSIKIDEVQSLSFAPNTGKKIG